MAATTFSIVAVFVPVAFMPGVSGEWFRPFGADGRGLGAGEPVHLLHARPDAVGLLGRPGRHHQRPRRGISLWLQRFNPWFDHQADRYGHVIAWALHHRRWMFLIAVAEPGRRAGAAVQVRRLELPADVRLRHDRDRRAHAGIVEPGVRARSRSRAAAALARTLPETKATNSNVNPGGGRVYVDIGKSNEAQAHAHRRSPSDLRALTARLVGAEYVVLDDLNMGAQKPVQIRFTGADSRKLLEITNDFMAKLRQVPGAVDVGLSEQDPQDELKIELDRGLANSLGISVGDAAQALRVAFAGVEVGDWVDPTGETRDVAVRLHPKTASTPATSSACRSRWPAATAWCRWTRSPPSPSARARARSSTPTASARSRSRPTRRAARRAR